MNKQDIIVSVAEMTNMTKKDVKMIVDLTFKQMENILNTGEKVKISGFGTFEMKIRKSRYRYNPSRKERVLVPEYKAISFKQSKVKLKD